MVEKHPDFKNFSCYLIGENSLLIQCSELLIEQGHQIFGVISPNPSIRQWAREKGIQNIDLKNNYFAFLKQNSFDYLFSVVNHSMLSQEVLELPRKLAINFHDSLLPKYAGLNTTSWAILNRELEHGVTWHLMEREADKGDVMKSRFVTIDEEETSYSLNLKCYEAGIQSFSEMIDELSSDQEKQYKQNLSDRTYFGKFMRPSPGCLLSWKSSAETMNAQIRACDFGPETNTFGVSKFVINDEFIIVLETEVYESKSEDVPGRIVHIDGNGLRVATVSKDILIKKVLRIDNSPLSIADLVKHYQLCNGYQFSDLEKVKAEYINKLYDSVCRHEASWVKRIAESAPIEIPYRRQTICNKELEGHCNLLLSLPPKVLKSMPDCYKELSGNFLFAAFIAFLGRISGESDFDIGIQAEFPEKLNQAETLFASHVPFRIPVIHNFQNFYEFLTEAIAQLKFKNNARRISVIYTLDIQCFAQKQNQEETAEYR